MKEILKYMPNNIAIKIAENLEDKSKNLEEIRLRVERPIILKLNDGEKVVKYSVSTEEMISVLQAICENSIYTYQNQIKEGFITVKGGHRIGICGEVILENGKIKNIKNINSMNIIIARQIFGAADKVMPYFVQNNCINNTLIVSPPRLWKNNYFKRYYKTNK